MSNDPAPIMPAPAPAAPAPSLDSGSLLPPPPAENPAGSGRQRTGNAEARSRTAVESRAVQASRSNSGTAARSAEEGRTSTGTAESASGEVGESADDYRAATDRSAAQHSSDEHAEADRATQPPAPTNDSYLEEEYKTQAGDTFAAISRKFYHDDKFAVALKQYNRDYPLATPAMKRNPDNALAAGTITWIPPLRILAKRYPGLTPDMPTGPTAATAPTGTMTQVSAGPRTYRVTKEGGESLQEIARRVQLPNDDWTSIHRLNPMLNPNAVVPIPKGTLLRLPAEARVEN